MSCPCSYLDFAGKNLDRRPGHPHRSARSVPGDRQGAAARGDSYRRIDEAAAYAGHDGRAGAGATGQGFAGAALVDAQADRMATGDFHEAGIDPLRKARVRFDQRAIPRHGRAVYIGDDLHGMGIAHRYGGDGDAAAADLERLDYGVAVADEGDLRRRKVRHAHVDRDLAAGLEARYDDARARLDADLVLGRKAVVANEADEAAGPVAALLDFAAIGIEDAVAEIDTDAGRRLDDQDLVAADAEMPVGEEARPIRVQVHCLAHRVDDDEVVAQSLHFREADLHALSVSPRRHAKNSKDTRPGSARRGRHDRRALSARFAAAIALNMARRRPAGAS